MTDEINPDEGLSVSTRMVVRSFIDNQEAQEKRLGRLRREIANIRSQ